VATKDFSGLLTVEPQKL